MAAAFISWVLRRGPAFPISNSMTPGFLSVGRSPTHTNDPPADLAIASYSRFARMQGGSLSSSLIGLLLATTIATFRV